MSSANDGITMDSFTPIALLGKGTFGKVWKVEHKESKNIYALKVLDKSYVMENKQQDHVLLERDLMMALKHPFIMSLSYAFQTPTKLCLAMEVLEGGSMVQLLCTRECPLSEEEAIFYAAEIVLGLEALHSHNVIYRDLKLENVLLDNEGHIKLTDFGLSAVTEKHNKVRTYSGTALYIAPEMLCDGGEGHTEMIDYWAFGVLLHLILTFEPPFFAETPKELFDLVKSEPLNLDDQRMHLSPECLLFLEELLEKEPTLRLGCNGAGDVKAHPWFKALKWKNVLAKGLKPPLVPTPPEIEKVTTFENEKDDYETDEMRFRGFTFVSDNAVKMTPASSSFVTGYAANGWIWKSGGKSRTKPGNWQRRWFVMSEKKIEYFRNDTETKPAGSIQLDTVTQVSPMEDPHKKNCFAVFTRERTYFFYTEKDQEKPYWMGLISERACVPISNIGKDKMKKKREEELRRKKEEEEKEKKEKGSIFPVGSFRLRKKEVKDTSVLTEEKRKGGGGGDVNGEEEPPRVAFVQRKGGSVISKARPNSEAPHSPSPGPRPTLVRHTSLKWNKPNDDTAQPPPECNQLTGPLSARGIQLGKSRVHSPRRVPSTLAE